MITILSTIPAVQLSCLSSSPGEKMPPFLESEHLGICICGLRWAECLSAGVSVVRGFLAAAALYDMS